MKAILHALKLPNSEISLLFVDQGEMAQYHKTYLERKGPTDILSFPSPPFPTPFHENQPMGDLLICMELVKRNAKKHKRMVRVELAQVLIHGVLHLMGHDHPSAKELKKMRKIEKKILEKVQSFFIGSVQT